ncbi:MAG: hypothetical protein Q7R65_04645 [bacterium]|nr:hypothetical protein [bacterium]
MRKHSKNGKDLLRDENNKKEEKLTFEIRDERSYVVFKDEYNSYWARQSYHRILDFYNYAKPISNKEKPEATTTIEFQLALGYMPYGGNPADNPEGFKCGGASLPARGEKIFARSLENGKKNRLS